MSEHKLTRVRLLVLAAVVVIAGAAVYRVPEQRPTIQEAISELAHDGDTISVWGPRPGEPAERVLPAGVHVLRWDAEVPARPQPRPSP